MGITELDKGTSCDQASTNAERSIVSRDVPNVATAVGIIWRHCHIKQNINIFPSKYHIISSSFYIARI